MAIGLPTPRPALRLVKQGDDELHLCFSKDGGEEVTTQMRDWSAERVKSLHHLCGYILCAKSPSCGMERVRVYEPDNNNNRKAGTGIFTEFLQREMPGCRWKKMVVCTIPPCVRTLSVVSARCMNLIRCGKAV